MKSKLPHYLLLFIFLISGSEAFSIISYDSKTLQVDPSENPDNGYEKPVFRDFRIAVGGGYAVRLGKFEKTNDKVINDINSGLRHGYNIDIDLQYFFRETWGIGLNANMANWNAKNRYAKETADIKYIGPSVAWRYESSKFLLVANVGLGPLFYNGTFSYPTYSYYNEKANTTTLGINWGISTEYKISKNWGVGVKASLTQGTSKSVTINGRKGKYDEERNYSSFLLGGFVSFRTW